MVDPKKSVTDALAAVLGRNLPASEPEAPIWSDARFVRDMIHQLQQEQSFLGRASCLFTGPSDQWMKTRLQYLMPSDEPEAKPTVNKAEAYSDEYTLLELHRSDVAALARFSQRVDHATFYLFGAIDTAAVHVPRKVGVTLRRSSKGWYGELAERCFARWKETRHLLVHEWSLPEKAEPLYRTAFWSLCELTPADNQLKQLFEQDRTRASRELVRHVDAYVDQLALAANLSEELARENKPSAEKVQALRTIQENLLTKAGERLTLTGAAKQLNISRQAMHKRIKSGAALGLMIGETLVVPAIQLIQSEAGSTVVPHLKDVLLLFGEAGSWSALQYLVEPDPALGGAVPIDLLKGGNVQTVIAAARAFLGLDEG